jgi:hypothetical protein
MGGTEISALHFLLKTKCWSNYPQNLFMILFARFSALSKNRYREVNHLDQECTHF